ncbi:MAG: riboflavin biosynthesis protein RibD [Flavobacteriales bacterium]|nr:riboflavin biosynthesis protein RibD [Flavobacteriales bacterium]
MTTAEFYMQKCLDLAQKGRANAAPNPMVGCVIVYDGEIIGKGFHEQYGQAHAEVNAVNSVKDKSLLHSSTLYVNLEPCAHFGKTPPCSELIIEHKIPKVVIGCVDTFSEVSGKGIKKMEAQGIEVIYGVLNKESRELNKRFFTFHEEKRPYIILKWAETSDGFIAPENQTEAFWMTSAESKKLVHQWRAEEMGILVGTETAIKDNPSLSVREVMGKNPIRFVLDKNLRLSSNLSIFDEQAITFLLTEKSMKDNQLEVDFNNLAKSICDTLYQQNIQSLIIEGGSKTLQTFIDVSLWDEARIFTAPTQLGGGIKAPEFNCSPAESEQIATDQLKTYYR